ncbi:MAG: rane protein involved in colicin uptake [Planctomycetaceae bacterium]|nr:rane protein involved in colicin uptake [Planctomycetaceae bacterium]
MMKFSLVLVIVLATATVSVAKEPDSDYQRHVKPLLKERCFACHGALKQQSGLRLDTGASIRRGGEGGPAITVGKAAESLLIERITEAEPSLRMPPEGKPLTPEQIALIRAWIETGAVTPENEQPEEDPRAHWAFRKPVRPVPPVVANNVPADNPIDAFITAKLSAQGLSPRPLADKPVILRRVYLDLIGLPPTREELTAFLAGGSPMAYEAVVDRLLKDPRYGERWARHWMDIWRYSDWYGRRDQDDVRNSASQIWRWRDWIVNSLNADHGYDRMVREMLAGDEINPDDPSTAVATGYLIRNYYSLNPNDWMRSTVEHTGKAFLGLTFNCAHCHDHKYDPIAHDDYFKLRAFFEPVYIRQDRLPGEADPGPFQEYVYGGSSKVQRLGMVRIFDKTPSAPTWFYTGGDERNRVKDRGSIAPGVPEFLADGSLKIESIELPPRAWYPGLRPEIQETILNDCRQAISRNEPELLAAQKGVQETPPALREQLAQAQSAFDTAAKAAELTGTAGALSGSQSLLLDATTGRRVLQNGVQQIKSLEDGSIIGFQLLILKDAHVNFQLAKDVVKGLTASFVGFDAGRILAYQPGTFTEFEAGRYDFAGGQKRFQVKLAMLTKEDRCLLSVRSLVDDKVLVDSVPVALNGWNPVGDVLKGISFDARTGSVAAIDEVLLAGPAAPEASVATVPKVAFDFEPPTYANGRDVAGINGWAVSPFGAAPATSIVSNTVGNPLLRELSQKLEVARQALAAPTIRLQAAESRLAAAQAELLSVEARITADRAQYGETQGGDPLALVRQASQLERDAAFKKAAADVLTNEYALAVANNKPAGDAKRTAEIDAATKQLATARAGLTKAQAATTDGALVDKYSSLTPVFAKTSTGRRRALAGWITSPQNPLTARVAVNHIWARHFHEPLVTTVHDFGRNGARPTHPELLDWLAAELMESGWSMQHLHRRIVTSAAYRRVSSVGTGAKEVAADTENKLLWRMNAGRMEAEVIRDSLLYSAGRLDSKPGGQELENSQALTTTRRSLYYSSYPESGGKSEFGELFDAPDPSECYRRTRSVVPQQALALTNSELVHNLSAALAGALWKGVESLPANAKAEETDQTQRFIGAAFESILSRSPTAAEREACLAFLTKQAGSADPATERAARARDGLVRVILNHNDFVTIR